MCGTIEKWKNCFKKSRGILTRLVFLLHSIISITLLIVNKNFQNIHFLLLIPLIFLFLESVAMLCFDTEFKYVWPCGFFYISTIVPVIWILELDLLNQRQGTMAIRAVIIERNSTSSNAAARLLINTMTTSDDNARRFCEIGVILNLILGRWLTPGALKGKELSALLLSYVGNAADILELLDSINSEGVTYNSVATYGILAVYTWALSQFALVTTLEKDRTQAADESEDENETQSRYSVSISHQDTETSPSPTTPLLMAIEDEESEEMVYGSTSTSTKDINGKDKLSLSTCWGYYHQEFPQMVVQILMQDGPFLWLRLSLCVEYEVISELQIFFMCKNALICVLLIYRFVHLIEETKEEKRKKNKRLEKKKRRNTDTSEVEEMLH